MERVLLNPGRWSRPLPFCASLILSLTLGCSGAGEGGAEAKAPPHSTPPIVRDSAGITILENAEPQWAPGSEWQAGRLVTPIGAVQGDPAHELFRALDATRQSDGTVAVGNSSSGEIRFFDRDGAFLRSTVLDSEMNLWAEEFPVAADDPAEWSVFDPDGVWLGRVTVPTGLEVYEIGSDYILGRTTDEMEVERILVFELVKDLA